VRPLPVERPQSLLNLLAPALACLLALLAARWADGAMGRPLAWLDPRIGASLVWATAAWLVIRAVDLLLWQRLAPLALSLRLPRLLRQFVALLLVLLAVALLLSQVWGVSVAAVLATTGVLGIVFGLALRKTLEDFFSGIALNVEHPFHLDDWVVLRLRGQVNPVIGQVREMNWRTTRIVTPEENLVVVPNSRVAAATIENLSYPSPVNEQELDIVLDWTVDPARIATLLQAALTEAWVQGATAGDKPPQARICKLDASGVTYRLLYLVDPRRKPIGPARHMLLSAVQRHMRFAGLRPVGPAAAPAAAPPEAQRLLDHDLPADRAYAVGQVGLFRPLTEDERQALLGQLRVRRLPQGVGVVRAGDEGSSMFVVVAGVLDVRVRPAGAEADKRINTLGPGETFGEMSLLTGSPRSASVVALTDVVLYEVPKAALAGPLQARPALAEALSATMAQHLRRDADQAAEPMGEETRFGLVAQLTSRIRAFFRA